MITIYMNNIIDKHICFTLCYDKNNEYSYVNYL